MIIQLFHSYFTRQQVSRFLPKLYSCQPRSTVVSLIPRKFSYMGIQKVITRPKNLKVLNSLKLLGISLGVSLSCGRIIRSALCKSVSQRAIHLSSQIQSAPSVTLREFWALIRPYFHWFIVAAAAAIVVALLNIKIPIVLGGLVDAIAKLLTNKEAVNLAEFNPIAIHLLGLYAAQALFTFFCITSLSIMGERMGADLRVRLFDHLLHFDMPFYDVQRTGELSDRLNYDVQEFKSSFKMCTVQGLRTLAQTFGCGVSMYLISPKMTAMAASVIPLLILVGSVFGSVLRRVSLMAQAQSGVAAGIAGEALQNIRTVKAFAMEEAETNLYHQEVEKARVLNERLGVGIGVFQAATNVFLNGIVLAILYGGGHLIAGDQLSAGSLISFLATTQTVQKSLSQLSLIFGVAMKAWTSCSRVVEFLKVQPSNIGGQKKIPYHSLIGNIEFNEVTFAYPTRPGHVVLEGLNLKVKAGTKVALCGPSGAGKSTIAMLIERLYEPQSGTITLDGNDLRELDPYWLRRNVIGLISQEPILFATTIRENIRYGKTNATDDEVKRAAELANATAFIDAFPDGYDTMVGERGVTLSGGQKQRIAIARALLKDPPVLILDEATSALDAESERVVQQALERVMRNRTVIIIAHRLSTIQNADVIHVIDSGGIVVESGTHTQLSSNRSGVYRNLVRIQQREVEE